VDGGRTWWAHFEFTRINIAPTILRKKMEENPDILWTESFLAIIDRTPIAGSQRSSPDIFERLRKSLRVYGIVGALVGVIRRRCA